MNRYVIMRRGGLILGIYDEFDVALAAIFTRVGAFEPKDLVKEKEGNWTIKVHSLRIVRVKANELTL